MTQMETDFVDLATRALAFTFVYYNAPVDMFTVFRVLFEYRYVPRSEALHKVTPRFFCTERGMCIACRSARRGILSRRQASRPSACSGLSTSKPFWATHGQCCC